ncbi:DUF2306 domain-containing protein [Algoriphagus terrigena]|uniref:DUF2306 domain-containing protein n=1 Tax=Algoriphagus terrigena TaxID=344884 RepID=UPI00042A4EBF|nr:DUF2306 domain-containing protein [Algoriphagus terrigena]
MSTTSFTQKFPSPSASSVSTRIFDLSTKVWFTVIVIGQMTFAYYIIRLYGSSVLQGNLEGWNAMTSHGYVPSDLMGNIVFGAHIFFAAVITIGGPIQLLPQIRARIPRFHRINGRLYIGSAFLISLAGLYLAWIRGAAGGLTGSIFITINALIILTCAYFAIRYAIQRNLEIHRQWAIRLFLAMSGVWFFRVFLMLWLVIHQAPVGFDPETFQGPFLNALSMFVYILPQVFAQIYFRAKATLSTKFKIVASVGLISLTLGIIVGVFGATMGLWLPVL